MAWNFIDFVQFGFFVPQGDTLVFRFELCEINERRKCVLTQLCARSCEGNIKDRGAIFQDNLNTHEFFKIGIETNQNNAKTYIL